MKMSHNLFRTHQTHEHTKRRQRYTYESPEAIECCSTGGDGGQACKKGLLMFFFFFQKGAGPWWVRSTLMTSPF